MRDAFDCGLPCTIVHGDLHLGNVAGDEQHVVICDWSDACIGHPLIDGAHIGASSDDTVAEACTAPWRDACPDADVDRAWVLAPFADRVFQAISSEAIYRAQEAASRWEMAGRVARTLRELGDQYRSARG